jgi:hypothetical protein
MAMPLVVALATPGAAAATSSDVIPAQAHPSRVVDFTHPTTIDNPLFPLKPGTEWVYEGTVTEGGESTPHRVVFTVSSLTKEIDGVVTRVIWDRDFGDGVLEESELAFFAQDDDGNLWRFGEYPEEFSDGKFEAAPSVWITGMQGARAGLYMLDHPRVGDAYVQGLARSIEFYDVARVHATDLRTCVPAGCFTKVMRTNETSPLDPAGGIQTKFYAPGVGLVRIGAIGGDSQERMTLRSMRHLTASQLSYVDDQVRRLDRRGHRISSVYAKTEPVRPSS